MNIKIVLCDPRATLPSYETEGASGFDLRSISPMIINSGEIVLVKTGLQMEIPRGYELQIRSRSGLALKNGVHVLNSPGTVDSDYRGEIGVILKNSGNEPFVIGSGDRIAQGVIAEVTQVEFEKVEQLSETNRGNGGFGSTGKK
jgi:dUTP pyrophosphatase